MRRALAYFAAFAMMGSLFAGTLVLAAIVLGIRPAAGTDLPTPLPTASSGPAGVIEIHAFDLGFEPRAVSVAQPGDYTVRLINDGGVLHDLTFHDGTVITADAHQTATGTVTIPAEERDFAEEYLSLDIAVAIMPATSAALVGRISVFALIARLPNAMPYPASPNTCPVLP